MLTVTSEHAIRALTELAKLNVREAILGRDLASRTGIPANYLAKILSTLRHARIVAATRGLNGGYRLAKRPEHVRLIDVVDLFEGQRTLPDCFLDGRRECSEREPCAAHEAWRKVLDAYTHFLETTTIASISPSAHMPAPLSPPAHLASGADAV